jgi:signal transduction histidine kinase
MTVAAFAAGAAAVALTARRIAPGDRVDVILVAALPAVGVAVLGALALRTLARRTVATQIVVVALTSLAVVAIGARAAASAMFLSGHDLAVLDLVLVVAALVALGAAFVLARRLSAGVATLQRRTQRIRANTAGVDDTARSTRLPAELAAIARSLDALDDRLQEADERQRRAESSRRELVAWVSHDLRTPLAGIRALAEALEDGVVDDPETVARYHRTLRVEADRLARLVDDLFELSRQSAGVLRLRFERVGLDDLVSDVLAGSTAAARAKGVELVGRVDGCPTDRGHTVVVSTVELVRALRNIVENAIRHTPTGGTVEVAGGVRDGHVYVAVTDTGGGIATADLERVFEAGFSGDRARTPDSHGAGLGLAIARGLIEAHHGTITAANVDGGARFVVAIPDRAGARALVDDESSRSQAARAATRHPAVR